MLVEMVLLPIDRAEMEMPVQTIRRPLVMVLEAQHTTHPPVTVVMVRPALALLVSSRTCLTRKKPFLSKPSNQGG